MRLHRVVPLRGTNERSMAVRRDYVPLLLVSRDSARGSPFQPELVLLCPELRVKKPKLRLSVPVQGVVVPAEAIGGPLSALLRARFWPP